MQQQTPTILGPIGRITIDITANGFIVTLPGKGGDRVTEALMQSIPEILKGIYGQDEDSDPVMDKAKEQIAEQVKKAQAGYELRPMKEQFVFPTMLEMLAFVREEIYKATEE